MSSPQPGTDPLGTLAAEVAAMGQRLQRIATELHGLRSEFAAGVAATPPDAAGSVAPPAPPPAPWPGFAAPGRPPAGPFVPPPPIDPFDGPSGPPPAGPFVGPPTPRRTLTEQLAAIGSARLLAWTGAAVTLLGVVLFLALAVSRGWFAPPVRIGAGTALGIGLIGLGWWLHQRPSARIGAVAVAATGLATLQLVIVGAAAIYDYLPSLVAVALSLLVAAGGLALADTWRTRWLAHGSCVGTLALAPLLTFPQVLPLAGVALVMSVAALPVVWRRLWPDLAVLTGAASALYTTGACVVQVLIGPDGRIVGSIVAVVALAVGISCAAALGRRIAPIPTTTLAVLATLPAIVTGVALTSWAGAALILVTGAALVAVAALPWFTGPARTATLVAAGVTLFIATTVALDGAALTIVLLGQALIVATLGWRMRSRRALIAAALVATPGLLQAVGRDAPLGSLVLRGVAEPTLALLAAAGVGALVAAVAGMLIVGCVRLERDSTDTTAIGVTLGVIGLYGVTALVVNLALAIAPDNGFTAGHALVTVSWTVAALFLLARGITQATLRNAGLALVAAAVAKLVLFDLAALDGIARVAAFLGAGLILLAAGTRYARLVTEHQHRTVEDGSTPPAVRSH